MTHHNTTPRSMCTDICSVLVILGALSTAALLVFLPGATVSTQVSGAPCFLAGLLARQCSTNATDSCTAVPRMHADVVLNTTDVKEKFDYIVESLTILIKASQAQSLHNEELREFMSRTNATVAANTAATEASSKTHEKAVIAAEKAKAESDDRRKSYNYGTFVSAVVIAATIYVGSSQNVLMVALAVTPYIAVHSALLLFEDWFLVGSIIACLSVFCAICYKFYVARYCPPRPTENQMLISAVADSNKTAKMALAFAQKQHAPPPYHTLPEATSTTTPVDALPSAPATVVLGADGVDEDDDEPVTDTIAPGGARSGLGVYLSNRALSNA